MVLEVHLSAEKKWAFGLLVAGAAATIAAAAPWGGFVYHEAILKELIKIIEEVSKGTLNAPIL